MPYITKNELNQLITDLPAHHEIGRTGKPAQPPKSARVARVQKENLEHLRANMSNEDISRIRSKYRNLPDTYWQGDAEAVIIPERVERMGFKAVHSQMPSKLAQLWELCSGSGALSARARESKTTHLPPIDLRYGWYTGRRPDQTLIVHALLQVGVMCLFAAPNCALGEHDARHAIRPTDRASGAGGPSTEVPCHVLSLAVLDGPPLHDREQRGVSNLPGQPAQCSGSARI